MSEPWFGPSPGGGMGARVPKLPSPVRVDETAACAGCALRAATEASVVAVKGGMRKLSRRDLERLVQRIANAHAGREQRLSLARVRSGLAALATEEADHV